MRRAWRVAPSDDRDVANPIVCPVDSLTSGFAGKHSPRLRRSRSRDGRSGQAARSRSSESAAVDANSARVRSASSNSATLSSPGCLAS